MSNSIHDQLEKIRKPRVHIKYEVETEGATIQKELPFVVGVLGDFAGDNPGKEIKPLKDRKFITIDQENFDAVMKTINPGVKIRIENKIANDNSEMLLDLNFKSMSDFEPTQIIEQIPTLRNLKNVRDRLRDLLTKSDRSDDLERILEEILKDSDSIKSLAIQLGLLQQHSEKSSATKENTYV